MSMLITRVTLDVIGWGVLQLLSKCVISYGPRVTQ